MAGFCCLVSSACLCVALLILQGRRETKISAGVRQEPKYDAWNLVATLRVSDASGLWCRIEPGSPAPQESIPRAQAELDAIKRGELAICESKGSNGRRIEQERVNPGWHTEVAREALKAWAQSHGQRPPFLQH